MHEIEPYYQWRDDYIASEDKLSPFYKRQYSELEFTHKIYNFYIHPQWDHFGSSTLYCKLIFCDYENSFCVIELIGEWNDALHNDIMELKRMVADPLIKQGIIKFILIGENVLNFHASDELYYEEWAEDVQEADGWIVMLNFREHIVAEMKNCNLHCYLHATSNLSHVAWRKFKPLNLLVLVENLLIKKLL